MERPANYVTSGSIWAPRLHGSIHPQDSLEKWQILGLGQEKIQGELEIVHSIRKQSSFLRLIDLKVV